MSSKDAPEKEQGDAPEQSQSTAAANRAKQERRKMKRAALPKMWGTSNEAAAYLGVTDSVLMALPLKRIQPRDASGKAIRRWLFYWPDVLELSDKWLKEATRYQKILGLD